MNLLELAQKRCSIRKYASSPVEDEKLAYILEAGRMAPSAVNFQPWYFVIIRQEAGRTKIQECYAREWFRSAPLTFSSAATTASRGNVLRIGKIIWTSMWQSPRNISA